jgi:hypothetical protein
MSQLHSPYSRVRPIRGAIRLLALGVLLGAGGAFAGAADEKPFLQDNDAAMSRMMTGMTIKPSGDVDRDFVAMMVPHHQGAIEMAEAELRYGRNEQLHRIAQEIIVDQQQEIAAMRLALGQDLPPSVAAPDQQMPSSDAHKPNAMSPSMKMN